jgi:CDP-glucose 4,6-dehydratase
LVDEAMENVAMADTSLERWGTLKGRSVLVTGHTGFKGSWLALWLDRLGARVAGYALDPPTSPNHFDAARVAEVLADDVRGDIRDAELLGKALQKSAPDVIFHLAAQPIVRESLRSARETFDVNVMGTASLLDAVVANASACVVVVVTSDKCYRNDGQVWGFREIDPLGGHDPYSASKAGAELVVDSYRSSFFPVDRIPDHGVSLVTVRAGNVIGGGDWAVDRIVPDAVRALSAGRDLVVRNPASTRPWQHVLEPLSGYLTLAARLIDDPDAREWSGAWNFGPLVTQEATVAELATRLVSAWGSGRWVPEGSVGGREVEAKTLRLAIDKAVARLDWKPNWEFDETVTRTIEWYRSYYRSPSDSMRTLSLDDIAAYEGTAN